MKTRLLTLTILGSALHCSAQNDAAPKEQTGGKSAAASASASVHAAGGKILIETDTNGKKETRIIDVAGVPGAAADGKVVIAINKDGKTETRVVDIKEAGDIMESMSVGELPPARSGPVTYLGVAASELSREVSAQLPLPPDTGLLIGVVAPDSPAAKAGLQDRDVLTKMDDQILITPRQLAVLILNHKEGDTVKLTYYRKGQPSEVSVTLGKHEAQEVAGLRDPLASVTRRFWEVRPDGTPGNVIKTFGEVVQKKAAKEIAPAEENVGREIRRALQGLPAEVRPEVERILREHGALPKGALPPEFREDPPKK